MNKGAKKSILIVIDSLGCGGAERSLVTLMHLIDRSRYDIDLLIVTRGGAFEKDLPSGVNIISNPGRLNFDGIAKSLSRCDLRGLCARLRFNLQIRSSKGIHAAELRWEGVKNIVDTQPKSYDVAIAYQQGFPTYYVAEKVTARRKVAWVNADIDFAGYRPEYNAPYYEKYDHIVAVSQALQNTLKENYAQFSERTDVIYDMFAPEMMKQMSQRAESFAPSEDGVLKIFTIGRIVRQKGYDIAVGAAKILKDRGYKFRWTVAGAGPDESAVRALIAKSGLEQEFVLLGRVENPYGYLRDCDIYAQTSRSEGFGMTITEARIFSRAIVVTNFESAYAQVEDGVSGLIAEMTPESVAENISRLIDDKALRESIMAKSGDVPAVAQRAEAGMSRILKFIEDED